MIRSIAYASLLLLTPTWAYAWPEGERKYICQWEHFQNTIIPHDDCDQFLEKGQIDEHNAQVRLENMKLLAPSCRNQLSGPLKMAHDVCDDIVGVDIINSHNLIVEQQQTKSREENERKRQESKAEAERLRIEQQKESCKSWRRVAPPDRPTAQVCHEVGVY